MDGYFQIKLRGRVVGQATLAQLQEQAQRGQLSRLHKISPDGANWYYASEYPGIFEDSGELQVPAVLPAAQPLQPATPQSSGLTIESDFPEETQPAADSSVQLDPRACWFVAVGEERFGPFSDTDVNRFIEQRRVSAGHLVWRAGLPNWYRVEHVFAAAEQRFALQLQQQEQWKETKQRRASPIRREQQSLSILSVGSLMLGLASFIPIAFSYLLAILIGGAAVTLSCLAVYDIVDSRGRQRGLLFALGGLGFGALSASVGVLAWVLGN